MGTLLNHIVTKSNKISRYHRLKQAGLCVRCGEIPLPNKTLCQSCSNKNASRCAKFHQKFYPANKSKIKAKRRRWYLRNRVRACVYSREYNNLNRESVSKSRRARDLSIKIGVMAHYGHGLPRCCLCPETRLGALAIDHIGGGGKKHRTSLSKDGSAFYRWLTSAGYPAGYRTLCANCNHLAYLVSRKPSETNRGDETRRRNAALKLAVMSKLGGRCAVCRDSRIDVLTVHHIGRNGAEHRRSISSGKGGPGFYRAILKIDDFNGLECRCFSCNDMEH